MYSSYDVCVCPIPGVGKTTLVHMICRKEVLSNPAWTAGCSVEVKVRLLWITQTIDYYCLVFSFTTTVEQCPPVTASFWSFGTLEAPQLTRKADMSSTSRRMVERQ